MGGQTRYAVVCGCLIALAVAGPSLRSEVDRHGYRFNGTASLPIGIYKTVAASNLISFCPPEPYASLSLERGYREHSTVNACPDHGSPFLKQIAATPGDQVLLSEEGIWVNGKMLRNSAPLRIDSHGRTLPGYSFGTYIVRPGEVWVINDYSPKSLDSRYYGPIEMLEIREHLKPVMVLP